MKEFIQPPLEGGVPEQHWDIAQDAQLWQASDDEAKNDADHAKLMEELRQALRES